MEISTPLHHETLQEMFLTTCSTTLPEEKYNRIAELFIPLWTSHTGYPSNLETLPLRNDFRNLEFTTIHRFQSAISEILDSHTEMLGIDGVEKNHIIEKMLRLLKEIFWDKSDKHSKARIQALHTIGKLVLENPAEFLKLFIDIAPGETAEKKITHLTNAGFKISISTAYRYLDIKDKKVTRDFTQSRAINLLEFFLQQNYDLTAIQIQPCEGECRFTRDYTSRIWQVEEILKNSGGSIIPWNLVDVVKKVPPLSNTSIPALYRWAQDSNFSLALLLGTCGELPTIRVKRWSKFLKRSTTSSTNPESL